MFNLVTSTLQNSMAFKPYFGFYGIGRKPQKSVRVPCNTRTSANGLAICLKNKHNLGVLA